MMKAHKERAHSKFSASGAERWFNCQGSVALSEGIPSKDSIWSLEGTKAHEVLELMMKAVIEDKWGFIAPSGMTLEMRLLAYDASKFIFGLHNELPDSEIMVETRVYLSFIHPEMFGTFDGAVVDHFGTLHVFDYKYGAGHAVSPKENLQMIFYGIGLAYNFNWNFKRVRLWIIQPRIKGYDGPVFWEITIEELKRYADKFDKAVRAVERYPDKFSEGNWCHWCSAKSVCPLKTKVKFDKTRAAFMESPFKK